MSSYSPRNTKVELLLRKAAEFEDNSRIRFSGERRLGERLGAIRAMIDDIAKSSRTDRHQLEQITERIENVGRWEFRITLDEWCTSMVFYLVSVIGIDLVAYPGIFEAEKQLILGRLLSLASRIGLSREQVHLLLKMFEENGHSEERLDEIENEFHLFLQRSHDEPVPVSLLRSLSLVPGPFNCSWGVKSLLYVKEIFMNPCSIRRALATAFDQTSHLLPRKTFKLNGLLLIQEMWVLLRSANLALMNIPEGFSGFQELRDLDSPLSEIVVLLEKPRTEKKKARIQEITKKLKAVIPLIEDYVNNDVYGRLFGDLRTRLMDKINLELSSAETRIILKPLLLRLVDRFFLSLSEKRSFQKALNPHDIAARWCVFLEYLVEGCFEAIQRGEASRISVAEDINRELLRAWPVTFFLCDIVRSTLKFGNRFGVTILENRQDWSSERMKKFQLVFSACPKLEGDPCWEKLAECPDWKLDKIVSVLSAIISTRNELGGLVDAEFWMSAFLNDQMMEYTRYIADHIIPCTVQLVPVLGRDFLDEHVGSILAYLGCLPERLIVFSKRVEYVNRTCGMFRHNILHLPHTLLIIEIQREVIHVDSSNLGFRDSLEAVFNDMIDMVEILPKKSPTKYVRGLPNIKKFLSDSLSGARCLSAETISFPDVVERLFRFETRVKSAKLALLNLMKS